MIISFYPGPSKIYEKIPKYVIEGYRKRIFSFNHRSPEFHQLYFDTEKVFKKKLNVPDEYRLLFTSSATEVWEIIAQSLIKKGSFHVFNGSFGEKWMQRTANIGVNTAFSSFNINAEPMVETLDVSNSYDFICLTHNETSNGTELPKNFLKQIKASFPEHYIAVDGTSSMGGVRYNWSLADLWYASVQKCFGLPSGMAVMICSPRLMEHVRENPEKKYYNSFLSILQNADAYETTHTPNILNIYLLKRVLEQSPRITHIESKIEKRVARYNKLIENKEELDFLISNPQTRSRTVLALQGDPDFISRIKAEARKKGLILGNGYGEWKNHTIRIANFPALRDVEVKKILDFLDEFVR